MAYVGHISWQLLVATLSVPSAEPVDRAVTKTNVYASKLIVWRFCFIVFCQEVSCVHPVSNGHTIPTVSVY